VNAELIVASTLGNAVERIGAYGGLASMIGLGVLALLYFAQAREVKRLREWAGRAPERAAEMERVQTDTQRRVIAQPQTPAAAAQAAASPAALPSATAGLTGEAATRAAAAAIVAARATHPPAVGPPGQLSRPAVPPAGTPGSPAPAPGQLGSPRPPAIPAPGTVPPVPTAGTPAPAATSPAPPQPSAAAMATKPPTATASTPGAKPRVVAQPPAASNGNIGQETRESAAARPLPPLPPPPVRPSSPSSAMPPPDDGDESSTLRIAAVVGGAFALVLVVGLVYMLVAAGDDPAPAPNKLVNTTPAASDTAAPGDGGTQTQTPVERGATPTTVLNGTTTAGLARDVASKLEKAGFKIKEVGDNIDQTLPATVVYYSDGNKSAAGVVARLIGVSQSAVKPVDRNLDVASSGARVVVTVGADLIE
jgi:LytR cell envelope-related transcriptional attenuator